MLVERPAAFNNTFTVYVAVDEETTAGARGTQLTERGLSVSRPPAEEKRTLDQGAYALALRLYAVAAVLVLLMAMGRALLLHRAPSQRCRLAPRRRGDAGRRRTMRVVVSAVAREFWRSRGAAVAGIAAGARAQYVVLARSSSGYVEALVTPRLVPGRRRRPAGHDFGAAAAAGFATSPS